MSQANLLAVVGSPTTIVTAFGYVLFMVLIVIVLWGTIKVIQGAINLSRGDAGIMDIIGGLLIAVAPLILWQVFFGFGSTVASDPTTASALTASH